MIECEGSGLPLDDDGTCPICGASPGSVYGNADVHEREIIGEW